MSKPHPRPPRRPRNKDEGRLFDILTEQGWHVSKRGWPDFFCNKDDEVILVEVKHNATHNLKTTQSKIMTFLTSKGIPCYKWDPESGFKKVKTQPPTGNPGGNLGETIKGRG